MVDVIFQSMHDIKAMFTRTGPVPNGSDLKIVTDWPFVHTGPANRTVNPFPTRSENWTSKNAGPVLEPFRSQTDLSPCKPDPIGTSSAIKRLRHHFES